MVKLNYLMVTILVIFSCSHKTDISAEPLVISDTIPGTPGYVWTQVLPFGSGSFPEEWKRGTFPLGLGPVQAFDSNLWMSWNKYAWSSSDGIKWDLHNKTDWGERISISIVYFKNKMWMTGGMRYKERIFMNDIWSTADGKTWTNVGNAAWSPRKGQTVVVFKDKLWLFGGSTGVLSNYNPTNFLNDVWSSDDGIQWKLVTNRTPWSPSEYPMVVVFNDMMYMVGGYMKSGIWKSADGINWEQLDAETDWQPRTDYGALVYDQKVWVFGGRDTSANHTTAAKNDVWYSTDGAQWTMQKEHAAWTVRSGTTSIVFKDKIWIFSGKHTGGKYNWGGDIWTMDKLY